MIIDSIRNYIRGCPLINKGKVNVDYLGVDIGEYSIEPTPADPIIKRYADGGTLRQYLFVFSSCKISSKVVGGFTFLLERSGFSAFSGILHVFPARNAPSTRPWAQ